MRLGTQIVDLVGLDLLDDMDQRRRIRQIAVVQYEVRIGMMRIFVDVIDAVGVEERRTPFDAMNLISFGEKKLRKICSILAGDTCNQRSLQRSLSLQPCRSGFSLADIQLLFDRLCANVG
jgi:hypothetical protein